jgi:hypothetical protein
MVVALLWCKEAFVRLGFCRGEKSGRRELVVRLGLSETVSTSRLLWLKDNDRDVLLTFLGHDGRNPKKPRLRYDVDGYVSCRSYVRKRSLSAAELGSMCASIAQVAIWCTSEGVGYSSVLFDERYAFVDGSARLHFAFVPLDVTERKAGNSPLALLKRLCDTKRLHFASPDAQALCERLGDYVLAEDGVFSLNRFREFVRMETSVMPSTDKRRKEAGREAGEPIGSCLERRQPHETSARHDASGQELCDMRRWALVSCVLHDKVLGVDYRLPERTVTVGRGSTCDVQLRGHPKISRVHLSVFPEGKGVVLCDLNSSNGTFLNGMPLSPGEEVRVSYGKPFFLAGDEFSVERREEQ